MWYLSQGLAWFNDIRVVRLNNVPSVCAMVWSKFNVNPADSLKCKALKELQHDTRVRLHLKPKPKAWISSNLSLSLSHTFATTRSLAKKDYKTEWKPRHFIFFFIVLARHHVNLGPSIYCDVRRDRKSKLSNHWNILKPYFAIDRLLNFEDREIFLSHFGNQ